MENTTFGAVTDTRKLYTCYIGASYIHLFVFYPYICIWLYKPCLLVLFKCKNKIVFNCRKKMKNTIFFKLFSPGVNLVTFDYGCWVFPFLLRDTCTYFLKNIRSMMYKEVSTQPAFILHYYIGNILPFYYSKGKY